MKQLKIAVFGHKRIPSREGGVEMVVWELSKRMARLGHGVTCYDRGGRSVSGEAWEPPCPGELEGIVRKTVPTLDKKGLAAVTSSFFAAVCAAFGKYDVVHIHAEGPAFMCWLPKLLGKRVVVTVHGLDWQREKWKNGFGSRYIHWGEKMAARFADRIIVLSENVQRYFRDTYGVETLWIPNGVNRPMPVPAEEIRQRWGLEQGEYILFLGRLVPEKGVHYLIEAFRNVRTDKKLVIAGGGSDSDDYVQRLMAMAEGDSRIHFTGFVQGRLLEELYSNAYIYVLPSDVEGMPLSLLEAMSYGNCCLVSDIPECTEVVGERTPHFARGDAAALKDALQVLCDNPQQVRDYQTQASDYICGRYNWDRIVEQTLELYQ